MAPLTPENLLAHAMRLLAEIPASAQDAAIAAMSPRRADAADKDFALARFLLWRHVKMLAYLDTITAIDVSAARESLKTHVLEMLADCPLIVVTSLDLLEPFLPGPPA